MTVPDTADAADAAGGTAAPPPPPDAPPPDAPLVVGSRAVLEVCLRAAVVLLVVAVVALAVLVAAAAGSRDALVGAQEAVLVVSLMYALHLLALAVLGWPGGLLTAHLMRHERSEARHVQAFALAGGVLGALVLTVWGGGVAIAVWAVVGAAVAGGARAWTGHARRRRAQRRATHPAASA